MSRLKAGKAMVCLILAAFLGALFLGGCGSSKYQAVDLEATETAAEGNEEGSPDNPAGSRSGEESLPAETMASFTLGDRVTPEGQETEADQDPGETKAENPYEDVDEVVVVTADVLNVRESENQKARIYAQLKRGSTLKRTGYNDEWSRVVYDGKTAYVSSSMVEVQPQETGSPELETTAQETEPESVDGVLGSTAENLPAAAGAQAAAARAAGALLEGDTDSGVPFNGHTVAVDAGHQAKANVEKEPIGPGSDTMKAKMPEGSVGVSSGVRECDLTLSVAQKLEKELKARGYHVVMIREGNDVNLSNAERAILANKSEAEIFLRLHANSMDNSGVYGALAMCMTAQNPYNAGLHGRSYTLSKKVIDQICTQTGTKNRGVQEVDNSSIINWSEIPVSVVEMGFMSNPDEDRWMQDDSYQNKIVAGIAAAVDSYFAEGN